MRLGKYQLLRKLATGGMAEVFLAKTDGPMGFEKLLVIKRILPHLAEDPQFVEMFLAEAKLAAQLNHPNLVQLFDFGEAEGSYFIAMEYIDGPNVRTLLARSRDLQIPISLALAARIVSSAAEGLAYAHDFRDQVTGEPLHLVHRDVSPDNILIGRNGAVKLVDFGIAKARGQGHHTQAGTVKGKVAYMAPEQLRAEPLDRRVDLYALGIVLYELCTGRMPFEASSDASMVRAVLYDAPIPAVRRVPGLPRVLQDILQRLLAKDRAARYPDCRALHADLEIFIQSSGEATTGFALSRLVAQLAPAAPAGPVPPPPVQSQPPGPWVTGSAFAPTSPILLSEPAPGGALPPPPLEVLELDRTVRSDARRTPPPPVPMMELERTPAGARTPTTSPGAFVFPTALGDERGPAAPVKLGLDRSDRRRNTGRMPAVGRGGGRFLRTVGLLILFLLLAAVGAWLGLAAAHRTDVLARFGVPVPGSVLGSAPATATGGTAPTQAAQPPGPPVPGASAPVAQAPGASDPRGQPSAQAAAPRPGPMPAPAPGGTPSVPHPAHPDSPAQVAAAPARSPGATAGAAAPPPSPGAPAPAAAREEPAAQPPASSESAPPASPAAPGATAAAAATPGDKSGTTAPAEPTPPAGKSVETPEESSKEPAPAAAAGVAAAAATGATESSGGARPATAEPSAAEPVTTAPAAATPAVPPDAAPSPRPATPAASSTQGTVELARQAARKVSRKESDKEKLLGAFAAVQAAKESTIRLESSPKLRVRMGGKLLGTTPVELTLPASPGKVELEFFDTGLGLSRTEQIDLIPGNNGTHRVVIGKGRLELKLQDGVSVSVDGKQVGVAPLTPVSLYEGRHRVELKKGEQHERRTLDIRPDQTEVLEFTFPDAD